MRTRSIVAAFAVATLVAAAPASAQTVDRGSTTFELSKRAASALKKAGVTVTVGKPARRVSTAVVLPVARGFLSGTRYLEHSGTLGFKRGKRKIVFKSLRTTLGSTVTVSGVTRGKRVALLTLSKRKPTVSSATGIAQLRTTKATLTSRAATLIRRALKLRKLSRSLGTVRVDAALQGRASGGGSSSTGTGTPGTGTTPGTGGGTTPTPGGGGTPANTCKWAEPPVPAPPAGAAGVQDATLNFKPRSSWIGYLAGGDGASDGTIVDGATESGGPPATDFHFPDQPSWAMPLGNDTAGLAYGGSLTFSYPDHGIEIVLRNPEIELNGAASRAIFRVDGAAINAEARGKRAALFDLNLAAASHAPGSTVWEDIPATVTADASCGVFGGMYAPGTDYGTMTVSFTR